MTARHEAIEAMFDADTDVTINYELATRLLDAIPPAVLARLAIEQGALVHYQDKLVTTSTGYSTRFALYRVVEQ